MPEKHILTQESYDTLKQTLDDLMINKRAEIAQKIQAAREMGDLSENAEYDAALEEQRQTEARIKELQEALANCEIFDDSNVVAGTVHLGCLVSIQEISQKTRYDLTIVDTSKVDSRNGKISLSSPIGQALDGHTKGDVVTVNAPAGTFKYKILNVSVPKKKES